MEVYNENKQNIAHTDFYQLSLVPSAFKSTKHKEYYNIWKNKRGEYAELYSVCYNSRN